MICRGCRGRCKRRVVKISIIGYRASRLKLNCMDVRLSYIRNYITPPPYHDKVLDQALSPSCLENPSTYPVVSKAVHSFTSSTPAMARPQEVNVAVTGITVLNPELTPDETLVEYASQPCGK